MTIAETQKLKRFYEGELDGYSYLEPAVPDSAAGVADTPHSIR